MKVCSVLLLIASMVSANLLDTERDGIFDTVKNAQPEATAITEEDLEDEFMLKISKDAEIEPLIDEFTISYPHATIKNKYTSGDYYGFHVAGVTANEIKVYANGCSNMVLKIFKLFHKGEGGGGGAGCVPKPPSGTLTFTVMYDQYAYETSFSIWELQGTTWNNLTEAYFPDSYDADEREVTHQFEDGHYSFDLLDSGGDGITNEYNSPGSFTITETDTGTVIYNGDEFVSSYMVVEFDITNGEASLTSVKKMHSQYYQGW